MKKIIFLVKRVILSSFILYGYNLIAVNFNMVVPINIYSLGFMSILGSSALIALVLFRLLAL